MRPYAELLEFNQPNPIRKPGFTRIRDAFGLNSPLRLCEVPPNQTGAFSEVLYDTERIMEFAGRGDYGEKNQRRLGETAKVTVGKDIYADDGSLQIAAEHRQVPILQKYIDMQHESMIEFGWATFYMEFSRVVLAEITRHRLASYQVESQRFVKYDDITDETMGEYFYLPDMEFPADDSAIDHYKTSLHLYKEMRRFGVAPQDARYVLPNAFKTRMVMGANVREWRHILGLRLHPSAQPEMRELMQQVYDQLVDVFPNALHGAVGERQAR